MFQARLLGTAALALVCLAMPAVASTVTVTSPSGLFTNPTPVNASNPAPTYDAWYANNVRSGGSAGITSAYPDHGNGSIQFGASTDGNSKADFEYYFTPAESFLLSDLTAFSYDYYRASSSTASAKYDPALRLYVSDGTHTGYLVYEPIYNGQNVSPVDTFVSANVLPAYISGTGTLPGAFNVYDRTAADWATLLPGLRVYGLSTGVGSGWDGSFSGAVDNITLGVRGQDPTTYNFETAATVAQTPEPSSILFLSTGVFALGLLWVRRREIASTT